MGIPNIMPDFEPSFRKIQRAEHHIKEIEAILTKWVSANDFHAVIINRDFKRKIVYVRFRFDELTFPAQDIALVIGDVLHNLRSALDLLWFETVLDCDGTPSKWTRFPMRDTRDELIAPMKNAVESKQIAVNVRDFVLDTVKPYKAGNFNLWALDDLNIRDKHRLLVPVFQLVRFSGVHLEDEHGAVTLTQKYFIMDQATSFRLDRLGVKNSWSRHFQVKDKGHAAATIVFDMGIPFETDPVIATLRRIAEEVSRAVKAFEILLT